MTKNKLNIGTILFYWNYYFSEEFKENIVFLLEVNLVNQCSKFGIPSRSFFWNFSFILLANLFKVRSVEWILDLWNERSLNLLGGQTFPVKSLEPAMFSDITNTSLLIANSFRIGLQTTPHAPTEAPAASVAASELKSFVFNSRTHCRAISLTC